MDFIGRKSELELLNRIYSEERDKTCMVYGRRRIGKTSLLLKFIEGKRSLYIDLVKGTELSNARRMADRVTETFGAETDSRDLYAVLKSVRRICAEEPTVVVFDELPYLIHGNQHAASEMQHFVDWVKRETDSMVVVCGSSVKMMSEGMLKEESPLYGRFAFRIDMMPMPITDVRGFHPSASDADLLKLYLTLGGVTAYHDMVGDRDYRTAVNRYLLDRNALVCDAIVYDLQTELGASSGDAMSVLDAIASGRRSFGEIADYTGLNGNALDASIKNLVSMRVIGKMEHLPAPTKESRYVFTDPAVSFWAGISNKYRALSLTENGDHYSAASQLISTHLGRAFELYCMDLVSSCYPCTAVGQWWGKIPQRDESGSPLRGPDGKVVTEEADIDVIATVRIGNNRIDIFGECKFTGSPMGIGALRRLESRVSSLGNGFNARYALFSASGFDDELREYAMGNGVLLFGLDELVRASDAPELSRRRGSHENGGVKGMAAP